MENGKFTKEEIEYLNSLDAVLEASETQIIYSNEFKKLFVEKYKGGMKPSKIFAEAGMETKLVGSRRASRAADRWVEADSKGLLGQFDAPVISHRKRLEGLKQKYEEALADKNKAEAKRYDRLYKRAIAHDKKK